jgi:hypothetical protein
VFKDLPDLMFIGLPACEADNALIVPLTGHELGHSLWRMPPAALIAVITGLQQLLQVPSREWLEFEGDVISSLFADSD